MNVPQRSSIETNLIVIAAVVGLTPGNQGSVTYSGQAQDGCHDRTRQTPIVSAVLREPVGRPVVLDLSGLRFLASTGIQS